MGTKQEEQFLFILVSHLPKLSNNKGTGFHCFHIVKVDDIASDAYGRKHGTLEASDLAKTQGSPKQPVLRGMGKKYRE